MADINMRTAGRSGQQQWERQHRHTNACEIALWRTTTGQSACSLLELAVLSWSGEQGSRSRSPQHGSALRMRRAPR